MQLFDVVHLIKLLVFFYKKSNVKENVFYMGLVYIVVFVGLASSSCMEKNYIYLALLIPAAYYRLCTCNDEAVLHIKRYTFFERGDKELMAAVCPVGMIA